MPHHSEPFSNLKRSRKQIQTHQLLRLNELLSAVAQRPFYRNRLQNIKLPLNSLEELRSIPLLKKTDLLPPSPPAPARIFDLPRSEYTRMHQTSGTSGWPLPVLDTHEDWRWWINCWSYVLDAAQVTQEDVAMMAFSFGPFIGFWSANDAMIHRGALVIPLGGMSSESRLKMIQDYGCTVLCCTPTYALHLVTLAERIGIDLRSNSVTRIIVAGEPGGSLPPVRRRIENAWNARVVDHAGASEVGAWGYGSSDGRGLHVIETEFICEVLCFEESDSQGVAAVEGELGELVLTNLGRRGGPAIRYRTGDIVRAYQNHNYECDFLWLDGGVIGRADDMVVIRGVNVFPSSVEAIVRDFCADSEYRIVIDRVHEMDQISIEIEADATQIEKLITEFRNRLALRIDVHSVTAGSLPRYEAKAKRVVDRRQH